MTFRCIAIRTDEAVRLRRATIDDFGYAVQRFDLDRRYPCRHCLREASGKTGMLLLSYQPPNPKSVYGRPTAIFISVGHCERCHKPRNIPHLGPNRRSSICAFLWE